MDLLHPHKVTRLIFIHKHNLLERRTRLAHENVQKTIQTYREAWGDPASCGSSNDDRAYKTQILFA
jgi:hypothetical protein